MGAAAGLVGLRAADLRGRGLQGIALLQGVVPPYVECRIRSADDTYGGELHDLLGLRHQGGHRFEGASVVGDAESGGLHLDAADEQFVEHRNEAGPEELRLIQRDQIRFLPAQGVQQLLGVLEHPGGLAAPDVRAQAVRATAIIEPVPEDLDLLSGQSRPVDASQQLLSLPGEHGAGDDVESTCRGGAHGVRVRARCAGAAEPALPTKPPPPRLTAPRYSLRMSIRRVSPLAGRKPTRDDLALFAGSDGSALDEVQPDPACGQTLRLLIVGINPGLWTAAVNAPFARPGNRFWPSLHRAGLTSHLVDASRGLAEHDESELQERGIGMTNLVARATARADELSKDELRAGGEQLVRRARELRPAAVAISGITAYRTAFALPRAQLGRQDPATVPGWPEDVALWVVPQPSGLNAHATVDSLAEGWREVARSAGLAAENAG